MHGSACHATQREQTRVVCRPLTWGATATSQKKDERPLPTHPGHLGWKNERFRSRNIIESGYGQSCGRDEAQLAIDKKLTLIAFEAMNRWGSDGSFGLHVFHINNELAGYASVIHALQLHGSTGDDGKRPSAQVIGFGDRLADPLGALDTPIGERGLPNTGLTPSGDFSRAEIWSCQTTGRSRTAANTWAVNSGVRGARSIPCTARSRPVRAIRRTGSGGGTIPGRR